MFHVLLRPEAKATQLACKEWDYFPGVNGKHWAPPAALIKIRLSSSIWPCKYLAEGCSALPARRRLLPLPGAQITLEGTAGFSPGVPPRQKPLAPPDSHTRFGEDSTISVVKGQLYLSSWVWPSSLSTAGSALLQREEDFAAHAQVVWGQMEAVGYSLCR